jgi:hypothetical protein
MADFPRVDEATISGWKRGEHAPIRKSVEKIKTALVKPVTTQIRRVRNGASLGMNTQARTGTGG